MNKPRTYRVRGPLPTQAMKPGAGGHRFSYRSHAKALNEAFEKAASRIRPAPKLERFHVIYRYCPPSAEWRKAFGSKLSAAKKPYVPNDDDNARSAAKHAVDGLVEAGLLLDDKRENLIGSRVEIAPAEGAGYLEFLIIEVLDLPAGAL